MLTPIGAMKLAIEEARKGLGFVAPNPVVGCVVVDKDGHILGKGYHRRYGGDHAELDAIKSILGDSGDNEVFRDATFYVTLEPCAHEGKTPSCAKKLATLPIRKVVYGVRDPNPLVDGEGVEILQAAGIEVEEAPESLRVELNELAEVFFCNQRSKRAFVALKVATSLDGQMAHSSGESQWITGNEAREQAHYLRAIYDATLVGRGTFLRDNPSLNVRHPKFPGRKNKVVVLDARGEILSQLSRSKISQHHSPENIFVVVGEKSYLTKYDSSGGPGVNVVRVPATPDGRIDLGAMLEALYRQKIGSVLVEGGARVLSAFLSENKADRFYQFIAPLIIGAKSGLNYSQDVSIATLLERRELLNPRTESFGRDMMVTGRLK